MASELAPTSLPGSTRAHCTTRERGKQLTWSQALEHASEQRLTWQPALPPLSGLHSSRLWPGPIASSSPGLEEWRGELVGWSSWSPSSLWRRDRTRPPPPQAQLAVVPRHIHRVPRRRCSARRAIMELLHQIAALIRLVSVIRGERVLLSRRYGARGPWVGRYRRSRGAAERARRSLGESKPRRG